MRLQNTKLVSIIFVVSIIFSFALSGCGLSAVAKRLDGSNCVKTLVVFQSGVSPAILPMDNPLLPDMCIWMVEKLGKDSFKRPYNLIATSMAGDSGGMSAQEYEKYLNPGNVKDGQYMRERISKFLETGEIRFPHAKLSYVIGAEDDGLGDPVLEGMCRSAKTGEVIRISFGKNNDPERDLKKLALKERLQQVVKDIQ